MNAKNKLNIAAINGVLLIGAAIAMLAGSWIVLPIAILVGVVVCIANGNIRWRGRNGRR